jgi:hypothetical protein
MLSTLTLRELSGGIYRSWQGLRSQVLALIHELTRYQGQIHKNRMSYFVVSKAAGSSQSLLTKALMFMVTSYAVSSMDSPERKSS